MATAAALCLGILAETPSAYTPPRPKFHFTPRFGWTNVSRSRKAAQRLPQSSSPFPPRAPAAGV